MILFSYHIKNRGQKSYGPEYFIAENTLNGISTINKYKGFVKVGPDLSYEQIAKEYEIYSRLKVELEYTVDNDILITGVQCDKNANNIFMKHIKSYLRDSKIDTIING